MIAAEESGVDSEILFHLLKQCYWQINMCVQGVVGVALLSQVVMPTQLVNLQSHNTHHL
jgi:hypothetical protein